MLQILILYCCVTNLILYCCVTNLISSCDETNFNFILLNTNSNLLCFTSCAYAGEIRVAVFSATAALPSATQFTNVLNVSCDDTNLKFILLCYKLDFILLCYKLDFILLCYKLDFADALNILWKTNLILSCMITNFVSTNFIL